MRVCKVRDSLMVRWYEPGREDNEFDPKLGNFFLCICKICCGVTLHKRKGYVGVHVGACG